MRISTSLDSLIACASARKDQFPAPASRFTSLIGCLSSFSSERSVRKCLICSTCSFDAKVSDDEAAKLKEIVAAWGCEGGTFEKETEGTGVYEAEDVKCKSGNYDFRITGDFKVFAITVD